MRLRWNRPVAAFLAVMLLAAHAFGSPEQENTEQAEQENMVRVYFQGDVPAELAEGAERGTDGSVMLSLNVLRNWVARFIIRPTLSLCSLDPSVEQIQANLGFSYIAEASITMVLRCP